MHEMSLCESVVQSLQTQAGVHNYTRVKQVWLKVGQFACVESAALRFCFDAVSRGTLAEGAALHIVEERAQAWCLPCERAVTVEQRFDACPACGSHQLQISGGEELQIHELEVE